MNRTPGVAVTGVSKHYTSPSGPLEVLADVSLAVFLGQRVAIRGVSGSGKSTLLNIIGGLDRPDAGDVRIADQSIVGMSNTEVTRLRRSKIGFVFQRFNLLSGMSALENVLLPLRLNGRTGTEALDQAELALCKVGLGDRLNQRISHLSAGEMQRAAIARAIVSGPAVLLADEPTGNLDATSKNAVLEILETLDNAAIIIVTHDDEVAARCGTSYALSKRTLRQE